MIDPKAAIALHDAIDAHVTVGTLDLIRILMSLDADGWQLTRKPEPIIDPVPAQMPEPVEAMVIKPIEVWGDILPRIWTLSHKVGAASPVQSEDDLLFRVNDNRILVEASTEKEALSILNDPACNMWDKRIFVLNGQEFEYLTDNIPF